MKVHGHELDAEGVVKEVPCTPECKELRHFDITYAPPASSADEIRKSWQMINGTTIVVLAVHPAPEVGPPDERYLSLRSIPVELRHRFKPWRVEFIFRDLLTLPSTLN